MKELYIRIGNIETCRKVYEILKELGAPEADKSWNECWMGRRLDCVIFEHDDDGKIGYLFHYHDGNTHSYPEYGSIMTLKDATKEKISDILKKGGIMCTR